MVTLDLEHCTASNTAGSVERGGTYTNTLTPDKNFVFAASGGFGGVTYGGDVELPDMKLYCTITMGGEDASSYFNSGTGEIYIDEVTGSIEVVVSHNRPFGPSPVDKDADISQ